MSSYQDTLDGTLLANAARKFRKIIAKKQRTSSIAPAFYNAGVAGQLQKKSMLSPQSSWSKRMLEATRATPLPAVAPSYLKKDQNLSAYFGADEDLSAFLPGLTKIVKAVVKTPFKQAKYIGKALIAPVVDIGKAVKFAAVGSKSLQMPKPSATSSSVTAKQTATADATTVVPQVDGSNQATSTVNIPGAETTYTSSPKSGGITVEQPPQPPPQADTQPEPQPQGDAGTEPKKGLSPVIIIAAVGALAVGGYLLSKKSRKSQTAAPAIGA